MNSNILQKIEDEMDDFFNHPFNKDTKTNIELFCISTTIMHQCILKDFFYSEYKDTFGTDNPTLEYLEEVICIAEKVFFDCTADKKTGLSSEHKKFIIQEFRKEIRYESNKKSNVI